MQGIPVHQNLLMATLMMLLLGACVLSPLGSGATAIDTPASPTDQPPRTVVVSTAEAPETPVPTVSAMRFVAYM